MYVSVPSTNVVHAAVCTVCVCDNTQQITSQDKCCSSQSLSLIVPWLKNWGSIWQFITNPLWPLSAGTTRTHTNIHRHSKSQSNILWNLQYLTSTTKPLRGSYLTQASFYPLSVIMAQPNLNYCVFQSNAMMTLWGTDYPGALEDTVFTAGRVHSQIMFTFPVRTHTCIEKDGTQKDTNTPTTWLCITCVWLSSYCWCWQQALARSVDASLIPVHLSH